MPDNFSQASQRNHAEMVDQHGREWEGPVEKNTGHPCAPPTPLGWEPPHPSLMPPSGYIRPVPKKSGRLHIDYDAWVQSIKEASQHWDKLASAYAHATYGDKAHEVLSNPTAALLSYAGPKPPAVEPVLAMREGNKWALGFPGYKVPSGLLSWWEKVQAQDREAQRFIAGADLRQFPDEPDELEKRLDLEEQYDAEATGGKREPVRKRGAAA